MDISPVPMQKGAFISQIEVHSPTPLASPDDDDDDDEMTLDSPAPIRRSSPQGLKSVAE